ncbi:GYF domain-containing protein [Flavobacterium cellulosilyticum]|uniref:GYF domain-containing protein n=1 Tax=Flavobacterium cellulosilyticum TaxID=2541731 RepID=A0A4R5CH37_9FLAO|nr:GYF domain-containing protein [Flavobacterium cellulosilyticum]TDD97820.1 hypothetical protein E0F76_06880 [Flavobacterium cellulosilyticum]
MKKYYLHIGTENSGPFDLEEIKIKRITKKTPVWFEGLENWKYAEEIEELKSVFIVTPPPIDTFSKITSNPKKVKKVKEVTILGLSKNTFFFVLTFLILLIATVVFNSYQEKRDRLLEKRNHKTEIENNQYVIQQKQINEQKVALAEQERLETERVLNEKKQTVNNRLIVIQNLLSINNENLENAKAKLDTVSGFKLFRTADEKQEQIDVLKNEINSYLIEIEILKKESNQLKLELEKIH